MTATETPIYRGAYRDRNSWYLTNDDAKLLSMPDEDVLFVDCREALEAVLQERNPCDDARLTRVIGCRVYDEPMYVGTDLIVLAALVQEYGTVETYHQLHLKLEDGFVIDNKSSGYTITYNPKRAARIIAAAARQKDRRYVTVRDIATMAEQLAEKVCPPFPHVGTYMADRQAFLQTLQVHLCFFNLLYGHNAHRQFAPWQAFARNWKKRLPQTEKAIGPSPKADDEGRRCVANFVAWMRVECNVRFKKPKDNDAFVNPKEVMRVP